MIEIEHLTKQYGADTAISDLNVRVDSGQIYGFLGPNGAGKSTTLNIITGCLSATEGSVRIDGYDIFEQPNQAKRRIGYLPEQPPLYLNESPLEYLHFVGQAKGLRGEALRRQISAVVDETGIGAVRSRRISTLSKGYRQRVGIAQALLGGPEVIILDEPTVGLDPLQIIEIRTLIRDLGQSHTVIFSSHILSEVQNLCDQILILVQGKLVAFDRPDQLEKQLCPASEIIVAADAAPEQMRAALSGIEQISDIGWEPEADGPLTAHVRTDSEDIYAVSRSIFQAFAHAGLPLLELTPKKATLEDVFLELTERGNIPESDTQGLSEPAAQSGMPELDLHDLLPAADKPKHTPDASAGGAAPDAPPGVPDQSGEKEADAE